MENRAMRENKDWAFLSKCFPAHCGGLEFCILDWETNTKV
jgi:hypothetical protein